jgi:prevent-host-death family protein
MAEAARKATAFEARTHLGELMDYVRYSKQPCLIERHGKKVAALLDIESYEKALLPQRYWDWVHEAVELIAKHYRPEKIYLFGSLSRGKVSEGSDIDLLIIKDTEERRLDRIEQVLKCLPSDIPVEPHVLTPQELEERLKQNDPFIKQAFHRGVLIYETEE